jgi:hypothetical protein
VGGQGGGTAEGGYSTIQTSTDGSNWTTASLFTTNEPVRALAYAVPAVPDINLSTLQIFSQGKPPSSINAHTIYATKTTIAIDNTLYIDKFRSSVAINSELPVNTTSSFSRTLYVSGIIQTYRDSPLKPSGGDWTVASDERIKENIELANLEACYSTVKALELYHYRYSDEYLRRFSIRDKSILGYIAQDVMNVFPKSVHATDAFGYENLLTVDQTQIHMAHYGATQYLMGVAESMVPQASTLVSVSQGPVQDQHLQVQPFVSSFYTLETTLAAHSTLYGHTTSAYESTIQSQTNMISTLAGKYVEVYASISMNR